MPEAPHENVRYTSPFPQAGVDITRQLQEQAGSTTVINTLLEDFKRRDCSGIYIALSASRIMASTLDWVRLGLDSAAPLYIATNSFAQEIISKATPIDTDVKRRRELVAEYGDILEVIGVSQFNDGPAAKLFFPESLDLYQGRNLANIADTISEAEEPVVILPLNQEAYAPAYDIALRVGQTSVKGAAKQLIVLPSRMSFASGAELVLPKSAKQCLEVAGKIIPLFVPTTEVQNNTKLWSKMRGYLYGKYGDKVSFAG